MERSYHISITRIMDEINNLEMKLIKVKYNVTYHDNVKWKLQTLLFFTYDIIEEYKEIKNLFRYKRKLFSYKWVDSQKEKEMISYSTILGNMVI